MNQTPVVANSLRAGTPATRVAIVASSWHRDIVDRACTALVAALADGGVAPERIERFDVPGAFELPLMARRLALSGRFDAVVACGLVVNGGIYRHEFVASAVIDGLMQVQLATDVPVLSAVLTPRDFHDHAEHRRFFGDHFVTKGIEVAEACLRTVAGLRALDGHPVVACAPAHEVRT